MEPSTIDSNNDMTVWKKMIFLFKVFDVLVSGLVHRMESELAVYSRLIA